MIKNIFQRIGSQTVSEGLAEQPDLRELEKIIHYKFRKKNLLILALKHRSYLNVSNEEDHMSNERLELLGDAVLELITTEHLYASFPEEDEGNLSQMRSVLVSRAVLGKIASGMDLGDFLLLNRGEEKTGGRKRQSNLANLFEALIGAIYLDGGYKPAKSFVNKFVLDQKENLLAHETNFNYKSAVLEFAQSHGWGFPLYSVRSESGPDHKKHFEILAEIPNVASAKGNGASKKKAEQNAAAALWQKIKHQEGENASSKSDL